MTDRRYVQLRALADTAAIRTATFEGKSHLVVPVVAMKGNSVVRPLGSSGPEFVPAEELAKAPAGWNGRPTVPDHPTDSSGKPVSANDPTVLEAMRFGMLFNSHVENGDLKMEAWLDESRASSVGPNAVEVCKRAKNHQMVEVSIGAWVTEDRVSGTAPDGSEYEAVWRDIIPDHLAMGLNGSKGACSNADGCGAPRTASDKPTPQSRLKAAEDTDMTLIERVRALFKPSGDGASDVELRDLLDKALFSTEAAYLGIHKVFPETKTVIYAAAPDEIPTLFRRSYTVNEEGSEVTLAKTKEEVKEEVNYVPAKDAEAGKEGKAGSDPDAKSTTAAQAACPCTRKEKHMSESTKELVGRLAANEAVPFDEEALKAMSEDQLKSLEEAYKKPEEKPKPDKAEKTKAASSDPPAPPAEPDPNTVVLTKEDYADIKAAADAHKAQQAAEKARLVAAIGKATDAYSKEALEAKPLDDLQALAKALKAAAPVDYSVRGLPDPNQGSKFEPPPKPYTLALERAAKQRGAKSNDDAGAPN